MSSIEYPDSTHHFLTYDDHARLASVARDGNAERVTLSYDTAGRVTVTRSLRILESYRVHTGGTTSGAAAAVIHRLPVSMEVSARTRGASEEIAGWT